MTIELDNEDCEHAHVDRDGTVQVVGGPQGFDIWLNEVGIHFKDERDAVKIATAICKRMGVTLP